MKNLDAKLIEVMTERMDNGYPINTKWLSKISEACAVSLCKVAKEIRSKGEAPVIEAIPNLIGLNGCGLIIGKYDYTTNSKHEDQTDKFKAHTEMFQSDFCLELGKREISISNIEKFVKFLGDCCKEFNVGRPFEARPFEIIEEYTLFNSLVHWAMEKETPDDGDDEYNGNLVHVWFDRELENAVIDRREYIPSK